MDRDRYSILWAPEAVEALTSTPPVNGGVFILSISGGYSDMNREEIAKRVPSLAASLLTEKGFVAPVDLLLKLDWLKPSDYEAWRRGRILYLERVASGNLSRLGYAMSQLRRYAQAQHLRPSWTAYVS